MKKKPFNLIGMVLGLAAIIVGIIFMAKPASHYSTNSVSYAAFGADFYTDIYDAVRTAAGNSAVTANNIRELANMMAKYAGAFFMFMGAFAVCFFGSRMANDERDEQNAANITAMGGKMQETLSAVAEYVKPAPVAEPAPAAEAAPTAETAPLAETAPAGEAEQ